jgi:hypothetical protein
MNPLDKQMAEIKSKADLMRWLDTLPEEFEGILLVADAQQRLLVKHLGPITLPRALWNIESYKQWLMLQ